MPNHAVFEGMSIFPSSHLLLLGLPLVCARKPWRSQEHRMFHDGVSAASRTKQRCVIESEARDDTEQLLSLRRLEVRRFGHTGDSSTEDSYKDTVEMLFCCQYCWVGQGRSAEKLVERGFCEAVSSELARVWLRPPVAVTMYSRFPFGVCFNGRLHRLSGRGPVVWQAARLWWLAGCAPGCVTRAHWR